MMTRDSNGWWWVMGGAVVTALSSRMDLIDRLIPAVHTDWVHALIEIIALLAGITAGVARMSPLPISPEGRIDAIVADKGKAAAAATVAHEAVIDAKVIAKAADAVAVEKDEA